MSVTRITCLLLVLSAVAGCRNYGYLLKRESELNCPTDIRKTVPWCAGEDAIFHCPCGPNAEFYGHKPTCWGVWPAPATVWRDSYCGCRCSDVSGDYGTIEPNATPQLMLLPEVGPEPSMMPPLGPSGEDEALPHPEHTMPAPTDSSQSQEMPLHQPKSILVAKTTTDSDAPETPSQAPAMLAAQAAAEAFDVAEAEERSLVDLATYLEQEKQQAARQQEAAVKLQAFSSALAERQAQTHPVEAPGAEKPQVRIAQAFKKTSTARAGGAPVAQSSYQEPDPALVQPAQVRVLESPVKNALYDGSSPLFVR
jgi:hypothetical protein